jgi:hypothetical protein
LDKIIGTKINLPEYEGVWQRYFSPQLSKGRNRPPRSDRDQKKNQDTHHKVDKNKSDDKTTKGKSFGKKHVDKTNQLMDIKDLDGKGRLTILAEIRSILRRLEY